MILGIIVTALLTACRTAPRKGNTSEALPQSGDLTATGRVEMVRVFPGTLSEFSFYTLLTNGNGRVILFNASNASRGFEEYSNRRVRVTGSPARGVIGWKRIATNGIRVRDIRPGE